MAVTAPPPAAPSTLSSLLDTLTTSLSSCLSAADPPTAIFSPSSTLATKDGISLLTTKNELLVSYLQNLVFLIILKLRSDPEEGTERDEIGNEVVQKLIELRAYMEKGIKPLEGKLRYQIEKVVRAAEDVERRNVGKTKAKANGSVDREEDASAVEEEDNNEEGDEQEDLDGLSYRPNPSALQLKAPAQTRPTSEAKDNTSGTYKPPRINPVTMPSTDPLSATSRSRQTRPQKSHLLEDYISTSLSEAPTAEPSIGSSSLSRPSSSRKQISQRERKEEAERRRYEEENFVRLPGLSKTEKKKRAKTERGRGSSGFELGGEDFGGLGEVGDRVSRAVGGRKDKSQGGILDRSRKRNLSDRGGGDGDISGGVRMGEGFEKRRRIVEDRNRRKGRT